MRPFSAQNAFDRSSASSRSQGRMGRLRDVPSDEVAVVAAERLGGREAVGVTERDGGAADPSHRHPRDRHAVRVDRVIRERPVEDAQDVLLTLVSIHRVAVAVRRDDERVEGRERARVPVLPLVLLLGIVEAEEVADHRHRPPVEPVEPDDERPATLARGAAAVTGGDVEAELGELAVRGGAIRAPHRARARGVGVGLLPEDRASWSRAPAGLFDLALDVSARRSAEPRRQRRGRGPVCVTLSSEPGRSQGASAGRSRRAPRRARRTCRLQVARRGENRAVTRRPATVIS